ncbi:DUF1211 domain-containing protein, partial [Frankia sp. AgB1.9]|uniref:TMEM175 family protein n=1 Tax=unclassified Frankia TaxID=2632575 RepID=UPI0019328603
GSPERNEDHRCLFDLVGAGLNLAVLSRNLLRFLCQQAGSFVAYVIAFMMLWIVWRQHHVLFDKIEGLSPRLIGWHFPLLLLIGFLPYPTTVLGHHTDNPAAAAIYALAVGALLICRSAVQSQALKDGLLREDVDVDRFRVDSRVSWIVACYFLATVALVWWTPWVIVAWLGANVLGAVIPRLLADRSEADGTT